MRSLLDRFGVPAALVLVAVVWGWAFLAVADAIARYPMYAFLAWRFALASVAFVAFYPKVLRRISRASLKMGLLAGLVLSAGYILQTWGLDGATKTTPARAAFITGLYVVITPLLQAVLLRKRPRTSTVIGGIIALGGLWLLSGIGSSGGGWVLGDTLVVLCAVAFSVHIIVLGSTGEHHDTSVLTLVQLVTVAVVCTAISAVKEHAPIPTDPSVIAAILLCGVLASAVAFAVQTWAQRRLPPSRVALILVTETAWGGIFGWSAAGVWPVREVAGAAAMFVGLIISEALAAFGPSSERVSFEPAVEGAAAPVVESKLEPEVTGAERA
ncbi:MAG: DMT family transporter [Coriobacteriia bacterium]|nr:DMT family transporter [Coriobacteriia bacterium]